MKTLKTKLLSTFIILFLFSSYVTAQEEDMWQAYVVHEDRVKPSKVVEYEKSAKALADAMRENDVQDTGWLTTSTDDFRYLYVSPIENMADLDKNQFKGLSDKIGQEATRALFSSFDNCYNQHGDYIIWMDKELTYMPSGITQTPEGKNYRKFYYIYVSPDKIGEIRNAMKDVKTMFEEKKSTSYYRVYSSGFGNMDTFFMVAVAAKDPVGMEQQSAANDKLLGPEAQAVFGKVLGNALKMEEITGYIRPELGYTPKSKE